MNYSRAFKSVAPLLLVCGLACGLNTAFASGDYVGVVAGEFRVSESGAATYQIPIAAPAGRAGVQPQVALSYNSSSQAEGLVGVGWSVSTGSAITRCPPTPVQDGKIEPITFTTSDKFCLDGQRMHLSTGSMGGNGSRYLLDIDDFSTITAHGSTSHSGNPKYFSVKTKSGETHYYGDADAVNSAFNGDDAFIEPAGYSTNTTAKAWLLKAVVDVKGNYIRYVYTEDRAKGLSYLKSIQYAGHITGEAPFAAVNFYYTTNEKGFGGYYFGTPVLNNQRLTRIDTYVDNRLYRRYNLRYEASDFIEERNLLTSVEECAHTAITGSAFNCKRETKFIWERPALASSSMTRVCESEPGFSFCYDRPTSTNYTAFDYNYHFSSSVSTSFARIFDIDGDGKDDIVYSQDGWWRVRRAGATSYNTTITTRGVGSSRAPYALTMDANGDGVKDIVVANGEGQNWYRVSFADGVRREQLIQSNVRAYGFAGKAQVADVNGDGREDIVYQQGLSIKAYLQPTPGGSWQLKTLYSFSNGFDAIAFENNFSSQTGDMKTASSFDVNGDGRSDMLMKVTTDNGYCNTSGGGGWGMWGHDEGSLYGGDIPMSIEAYQDATSVYIDEMDDHEAAFRAQEEIAVDTQIGGSDGPYQTSNQNRIDCIDMGGSWVSNVTSNFRIFVATGTMSNPKLQEREILTTSGIKQIRPADFNGDGLTDIAYVIGSTWYYRLSTGTDFTSQDNMGMSANDSYNFRTQFVDLNRDGRADMLQAKSTTSADIYFSRPNMASATDPIFERRGSFTFGSNNQLAYGDVDGDGKLDLLKQSGGSWRAYTKRRFVADYTIKRIENGFGVGTDITYKPMTDAGVYIEKPAHSGLDGNTISPRSGGFLVSQVYSDSNVGQRVGVKYQYGQLRLNTQGRGSLGFGLLRTTDLQTNIVTDTRYYQNVSGSNYALVGMPLSTTQKYGSTIISSSTNTLAVRNTRRIGSSSQYAKLPYVSRSIEKSYWVNNNAYGSTLAQTMQTDMVYDSYGNVTSSLVKQTDESNAGSNESMTTHTVNQYHATAELKRLGRLIRTDVTKKRDGVTTKRASSFTYDSSNMLASSTQWGDSVTGNYSSSDKRYVGHHLKTLYGYDKYGNQTRSCQTNNSSATLPSSSLPSASTNVRCSQTTYFSGGRYVQNVKNGNGETVTFSYASTFSSQRGVIASITETSDNGIGTKTDYDTFGQVTKVDYPDSRLVTHTRGYSGSYGAKFYERVDNNSGADVITYYDKFGREIVKRQEYRQDGNDYSWLTVYTDYDSQGRVSTVSLPNSTAVTQNVYDRMGRVVKVYHPNGGDETTTYSGYRIITENALGQRHTVHKHGFGETSYTEDNDGNRIEFIYDAYGQLTRATTRFSNATQTVETTYDSWGRKVETKDPNKGTWRYTYNSFGELTTQKDGNAKTYWFYYDNLGRMTKRYNSVDGTTCWLYGSTGHRSQKASGKLLFSGLFTGNFSCSSNISSMTSSSRMVEGRQLYYDSLGRMRLQNTRVDGKTYTHQNAYNSYSQVTTQTLPTGHRGISVTNFYDNLGALRSIRHNQTNRTIWEAEEYTSRGQLSQISLGNGIDVSYSYDISGYNTDVRSHVGSSVYHSAETDIDDIGNVTRKVSRYRNTNATYQHFTEDYQYDSLNRLTRRQLAMHSGTLPSAYRATQTYAYDDAGNFSHKSDKGFYKYSGTIANRLVSIHKFSSRNSANVLMSFSYDNNGNVKTDGQRSFTYNNFDKPTRISMGTDQIDMVYGVEKQMLKKTNNRVEGSTRIITHHTYVGNVERIQEQGNGNSIEYKYTLAGGAVIITQHSGSDDFLYLHKDTQGSVAMVTNQSRTIITQALYDPFGKQTMLYRHSAFNNITYQEPTEKGYTGHQQLNSVGITHMGGRIYDASIGRFMQADPFIQAPNNTQNYNRYSYVLNNPMSYTDPSGFNFVKALGGLAKGFLKSLASEPIINAAVQIGIGIACGAPCLAAYSSAQTYALTGSLGASLRAGVVSYATSSAFKAVGGKFTNTKGGFFDAGVKNGFYHIASHAVVGGVSSTLQGGKFGHGFFSAGITKGLTPQFEGIGGPGFEVNGYDVAEATIAGVLGGTISKATGGKFANGAVTAAMGNLFNNQSQRKKIQAQRVARAKEAERKRGGRFQTLNELKATMKPGDLRFGIRPLDGSPLPLAAVNTIGANAMNLSLVHEHIVYMDQNGQLQNIGFTGPVNGVSADTNFAGRINSYRWGPIQQVNISNINFSSSDFQASNYNVVFNNCQGYCTFIRKQL